MSVRTSVYMCAYEYTSVRTRVCVYECVYTSVYTSVYECVQLVYVNANVCALHSSKKKLRQS